MRTLVKKPSFKFLPFSKKQKKVLTWWIKGVSPYAEKDCIIADGAIRAGKTLTMSLSFILWAMESFKNQNFGMAGKTIGSFKRNVWLQLKIILLARGYRVTKIADTDSNNAYAVTKGETTNYIYIFGGKDERSQDLVQGFTSAGFFFDEVALMPETFVNQAVARCSVEGAKLWFNCNAEGPFHWFKLQWIDNLKEKNAIRIQFNLNDNPSLSEARKQFYERMFSGVFYKRYVLGLWVLAEGVIYDMFNDKVHIVQTEPRAYTKFYCSIDYGMQNPTTFNLWGLYNNVWYKVREYHHSGREGKQKTDSEYYDDLERFIGSDPVTALIIDPSAASFIVEVKKRGRFTVKKANNEVIPGIRRVSTALKQEKIKYNDCCTETFKEFNSYCWDVKASNRGKDEPLKQNDHHMDADRYFVSTVIYGRKELAAVSSF